MLGQLPLPESTDLTLLDSTVINVNYPRADGEHFKGFRMARQSGENTQRPHSVLFRDALFCPVVVLTR